MALKNFLLSKRRDLIIINVKPKRRHLSTLRFRLTLTTSFVHSVKRQTLS